MSNRACLICGAKEDRELLGEVRMVPEDGISLPSEYNIVKCDKCGFCFGDTSATLNDYDKYYENCNVYASAPESPKVRDELTNAYIDICDEYMSIDTGIIDIGVGQGGLLKELKHRGYNNLYGMDPSENSVEGLRKAGIINAYKSSIYDSKLNNMIQFVFSVAVFEHLLRADIAVDKIHDMLIDNGYAFISVPDYGNLQLDSSPKANNFNCEHINYFSETSLSNLFVTHGFKKILSRSFPILQPDGSTPFVLCVLFQKNGNRSDEITYDNITHGSIHDYLGKATDKAHKTEEKIETLFMNKAHIYLWGAGNYTMQILRETKLSDCNIAAIIDNNTAKWGGDINQCKILGSDYLKEHIIKDDKIVICSMLYADEITKQIRNMNINNEIIVL